MRKSALFGILLLGLSAPAYAGQQERAMVTGAFLGAMSGAAIGSNSGEAGKGAVVGAFVGAIAGAVLSDVNRQPMVVTHHPQPRVVYSRQAHCSARPAVHVHRMPVRHDSHGHGYGHERKERHGAHNPPYHVRRAAHSAHARYEKARFEDRHAINRGDARERMHRHYRDDDYD